MNILEINKSLIPIFSFIGKILNIIHIVVPIGLILFVTIDLAKAVLSNDNDMVSRTLRNIRNRIIACLLIFFLPTIVEYIFQQVYISLDMNLDEYKEIVKSYKSIIKSDDIDPSDNTKSKNIESDLDYSIDNKSIKEKDDEEKNRQYIIDYSKKITPMVFVKNPKKEIKNLITNDFFIGYKNKKYKLGKLTITYDKLDKVEVSNSSNYIVSNVIVKNARINKKDKYDSASINYYFKLVNKKYVLDKVSIENINTINEYISKSSDSEKPNDIVASSKYISSNAMYSYSKLNNLSDEDIKEIYNNNSKNIVMLNTISNSAVVNRATGFFLGNGTIVTSWSYLENSFINGQTIVVTDIDNNAYKILGVISINSDLDIAVLKLNKAVNKRVKLSTNLPAVSDPVITITSKTGVGLTSLSGIASSINEASSIVSVMPLSKNDWGSPLFNLNGEVIGMNTSKLVNSEVSNASSIVNLLKLQQEILNTSYANIKAKDLEKLKQDYFYQNENTEKILNSIPKKVWDKYKKIGNIGDSIFLDLVKASYYDNVVSLRYDNKTYPYIDSFDYTLDFVANLEKDGYKKVIDYTEKKMYKKGNKKIILMKEFNYLIIIMTEGSLL